MNKAAPKSILISSDSLLVSIILLILLILALLIVAQEVSAASAAKCASSISLFFEGNSEIRNGTLRFRPVLSEALQEFAVEYWIEDPEGNIIRDKKNTTNLNWKSFTPKTSELSSGTPYSLYMVNARLISGGCAAETSAEKLVVFGAGDSGGKSCTGKECVALYLEHAPKAAVSGESLTLFLAVENRQDKPLEANIYSYVYRGSKTYSPDGKKDTNEQQITIPARSSISLELANPAPALPGEYRLKVMLASEGNLSRDISFPINITAKEEIKGITISSFYLDSGKNAGKSQPKAVVLINNSGRFAEEARLLLETPYDFSELIIHIGPASQVKAEFPLKLQNSKNPIFLKLYHNATLIDIAELIAENSTALAKEKGQLASSLPYSGQNNIQNKTQSYASSSEKSGQLVIYVVLLVSLLVNASMLLSKKKKLEA